MEGLREFVDRMGEFPEAEGICGVDFEGTLAGIRGFHWESEKGPRSMPPSDSPRNIQGGVESTQHSN